MKIAVESYSKVIKGNRVLNEVSLDMESGNIYGLKGSNGSGKTMLMRAVSGLIRPTEGRVVIDGEIIGTDISFPRSIGILLENPAFLSNYTGYDNLKMLADLKGVISREEIKDAIMKAGLDPDDRRKYGKYSLGMKQKLGIACAVMEQPELLILDEPFNALDKEGIRKTEELILSQRDRGALVILSCHDSKRLEDLADHIIELDNGAVVSET